MSSCLCFFFFPGHLFSRATFCCLCVEQKQGSTVFFCHSEAPRHHLIGCCVCCVHNRPCYVRAVVRAWSCAVVQSCAVHLLLAPSLFVALLIESRYTNDGHCAATTVNQHHAAGLCFTFIAASGLHNDHHCPLVLCLRSTRSVAHAN